MRCGLATELHELLSRSGSKSHSCGISVNAVVNLSLWVQMQGALRAAILMEVMLVTMIAFVFMEEQLSWGAEASVTRVV